MFSFNRWKIIPQIISQPPAWTSLYVPRRAVNIDAKVIDVWHFIPKEKWFLNFNKAFEYCCDNVLNYLVTKFNTAHAKPNTKFCTQITIKKLLLHYLKIILNYFYVEKIPERTWVDLLYLRKCKIIRPSKFHTCHGIFSYACHLYMPRDIMQIRGEVSPAFANANAIFLVFTERIGIQFLKK